jgi:probable H4MPT-linked C1 transfer pathway protein
MSHPVLGLDIGGANLKVASDTGFARHTPFALWREPARLPDQLNALLHEAPAFERLAVTMTGELCDCFETKRQGVEAILDAVEAAARGRDVLVWRTDGRFCDVATARSEPLLVAAANWLATATLAGRFAPHGAALLVDVGSTTTDIVPIWNGRPAPLGRTDPERLILKELVYTGARRTPVCALLGEDGAAEFFATMHDVYLMLRCLPEDPNDRDTADGRPATVACAHSRLARMMGGDVEITSTSDTHALAERLASRQAEVIRGAVHAVSARLPMAVETVVLAGSGEFVGRSLFGEEVAIVSLNAMLGAPISAVACAYAVAVLASESKHNPADPR